MEDKSIAGVFSESALNFAKNPLIITGSAIAAMIVLMLLSFVYTKLGGIIVSQTAALPIMLLVVFILLALLPLSYLFSGLINICLTISKKTQKTKLSDFFRGANKYWGKNYVIMLIIFFLYRAIFLIMGLMSIYILPFVNKQISVSVDMTRFILFFIYFAWLIGVLIFLTFSNFFLILENLSIIKSIKKSAVFVSNNYVSVLAISVIFYIIFRLVSYTDRLYTSQIFSISEIISSIIIYPYLALVLAKFLIVNNKK